MNKYINFIEMNVIDSKRKTKQFYVKTIKEPSIVLGYILFFPQWRKYTYHTDKQINTILDANCLREIADFCEKETRDWRFSLIESKKS